MGGGPSQNEEDIASQALVLMVNAINGHWRLPIANFMISSLSSKGIVI